MLRHKNIERVCCLILALTLAIASVFVGAAATGKITANTNIGYENRLFDKSRVHTIDIVMDNWEEFLTTCTSEIYASCTMVIDGEKYSNVAIRGKGNTSLSSVAQYGNDRYSFKVEFDHYQNGHTYHGLDKLSLNNLISDNSYMKDYLSYTLMEEMGVASPLCSYVQINVNGEPWGLYLAVEGVEDSFLTRNYGKDHGELYKPDSLSMGARGDDEDASSGAPAGGEGGEGGDDGFGASDGSSSGQANSDTNTTANEQPADASNGEAASENTVAEAPATEAPATEAPVTEAPASEQPATSELPADASTGDSAGAAAGEMPADFDASQLPADASTGESAATAASEAPAAEVPASEQPATSEMPADASNGDSAGAAAGELPADFDASQLPEDASTGESAATTASEAPAAEVPASEQPATSEMPADASTGDSAGAAAGELPADFDASQLPEDASAGESAATTASEAPAAEVPASEQPATSEMPADASNGDSAGAAAGELPADFDASQLPEDASAGESAASAASEAPATEAPAAEVPASEQPATSEMPADASTGDSAGAAAGELPADFDASQLPEDASAGESAATAASEAPASEAPVTEAPAAEVPATEKPAANTQNADASSGDSAGGSSGESATGEMSENGEFTMPEGDRGGFNMGGFGFGSASDVKLQYIDDNPSSYSNIFNNAKTDVTDADKARLIESLKKLSSYDTSVISVDAVITYMAVHNFLCNDDSYTGMMIHNYYLYEENGVLEMIPWDYNLGFGGFSGGNATNTVNTSIRSLISNGGGDRPMADWIMKSEEYMAQYLEVYQQFMDQMFNSGWFVEEIDRVIAMIDPYVKEDVNGFCTYEQFVNAAQILKEFCLLRAESVNNQLNGDNTRVDASSINLSALGSMNGNGGGFEAPAGDFNAAEGGEGAAPAADGTTDDGFGASSGDSSGGQSAAPAENTTPAEVPAETVDGQVVEGAPAEGAPADNAAAERGADRPFGGSTTTVRNSEEDWYWFIGCIGLLLVGLLISKLYRTTR